MFWFLDELSALDKTKNIALPNREQRRKKFRIRVRNRSIQTTHPSQFASRSILEQAKRNRWIRKTMCKAFRINRMEEFVKQHTKWMWLLRKFLPH